MVRDTHRAVIHFANIWLVLCPLMLSAQIRTNFSLLDSLTERAVADLVTRRRCDTMTVVPTESPARWLVQEKLLRRGISHSSAPCTVAIGDCSVRYHLHPSKADSIVRTIAVELRLLTTDSSLVATAHWCDTLARSDVLHAELPRSELTTAPLPPPPRSLWNDILEPVIIVASTALTLLLLFTARTR